VGDRPFTSKTGFPVVSEGIQNMKLSQLLTTGIITSGFCMTSGALALAGGPECAAHKITTTAVAVSDQSDCTSCGASDKATAVAVSDKAECTLSGASDKATAVAVSDKAECTLGGACDKATAVAVSDQAECTSCGKSDQTVAIAVGDTSECTSCNTKAALASINAECPGMGGEVDASVTTVYKGFTIGYCCDGCIEGFENSSETMKDAFVMQNATLLNTECPISGDPVDTKAVSLYNGFAVAFCCEKCQARFDKGTDSEKVATIAKYVSPVNTECPNSGHEVAEGSVVAYRGNLIGFCGEGGVAEFNQSDEKAKTAMLLKAANITMNEQTGALECQECKKGGGEAAAL
jgi:YHS domain-containing protein